MAPSGSVIEHGVMHLHAVTATVGEAQTLGAGGQALADGPYALADALAQLLQGLVDQRAFDQGGDVCHRILLFRPIIG
jgi:hypothetical protein